MGDRIVRGRLGPPVHQIDERLLACRDPVRLGLLVRPAEHVLDVVRAQ
jgi:hypothetical protein